MNSTKVFLFYSHYLGSELFDVHWFLIKSSNYTFNINYRMVLNKLNKCDALVSNCTF